MKKVILNATLSTLLMGVLLSYSNQSNAAQARALTYACGADCSDSSGDPALFSTSYAAGWLSAMSSAYSETTNDCTIFAEELADASFWSGGLDHTASNIDDGDATLLVTHGGCVGGWDHCTSWNAYLTTASGHYSPPPGDGQCTVNSANMDVGDNDAEFFHSTACHSSQMDLLYEYQGHWKFPTCNNRLHQYGGFHGTANSMNWDKLDDFATQALQSGESIAWAWIENMTLFDAWGSGSSDLCPASHIHGYSVEDAGVRRDNERYNGTVYSDPPASGAVAIGLAYTNCDPPNGLSIGSYM
ncbi:MAG: hypothetical protein JXR76_24920 [Deltaproteobacteria bacterium]|nr:hypothetical protein [Deltaproteobacteria bacterium]